MKFLADMGIAPRTVAFLRAMGHDATHLHEENLDRLPDRSVLRKAMDEDRILLTHDLDFGELMAASGASLPSVIVFRLRNMHATCVNYYPEVILSQHTDSLESGAMVSVTEGQVRVRLLPFSRDSR